MGVASFKSHIMESKLYYRLGGTSFWLVLADLGGLDYEI